MDYFCPDGHPVKPPNFSGRGWCTQCDDYVIPKIEVEEKKEK